MVVEGQAGIGKSSLLDQARRRASAAGMTVLMAQGAALEQDFGFGVVRQLFEPVIRDAGAGQRQLLLSGAATLAAPAVAPDEENDAPPSQQAAIVHGLYWLTAALAEQAPVLLGVDDVQWADVPSLRFLAHLVRRLEGIAVVVAIAVRTGDTPADASALAEIFATRGVRLLRPAALSAGGVARLMQARLGKAADPSFVEACRVASGGVPVSARGARHRPGGRPGATHRRGGRTRRGDGTTHGGERDDAAAVPRVARCQRRRTGGGGLGAARPG